MAQVLTKNKKNKVITEKIFKFGENVTEMTAEFSKPRVVSGIMAEGTDGNGNIINTKPERLWDSKSVKKYGYVIERVDFGQLSKKVIKKKQESDPDSTLISVDTLRTKLKSKAEAWMKSKLKNVPDKITVKGVDNYYLYGTIDRIDVGDLVKCVSKPHGINVQALCLSMEIDFLNHQNDQYIIGPYIANNWYDPKISKKK